MTDNQGKSRPSLAEEHFRLLAESATDYAFLTFDLDNRLTSWSSGAEHILGYSEAEALGLSGVVLLTPEDQAQGEAKKELETALREGRATDERWHVRKDGSRFWASGVMTLLHREDHRVVGFAKVMRDLTARKQAQESLRESEERFRSFAENSTDALWILDAGTQRLEYLSPAFERIWGEPRESVISNLERWAELVHPADRERALQSLPRVLAGHTHIDEYRIVRPSDGAMRWIRDTGFSIRNAAGAIQRIAGIAQDITKSKRAEEALHASEARFRAVADLVPDLLWSHDPEGYTVWHNQRWLAYTGQTPEQAHGFGWLDAVHPEDREGSREQFIQAVRSGKPLRQEHRIRRSDGAYRWFLVQAEPVRDEYGHIVQWFGAATDIHEQRLVIETRGHELDRTKDDLRALTAQLITAQEDEQRRIARELHDSLAQQLAALEIELQHLCQNVPADPMQTALRLSTLQRQAGAISEGVRGLSHRLHPSILEDLGLAAALHSLVEEMTHVHGLTVHLSAPELLYPVPLPVATTLYRIAQEALRNVVKHGAEGTLVSILVSQEPHTLHLTVRDTGPGFAPQPMQAKGGLGIVSMQERARLIGGTLQIQTAPGQGTTVQVVVPWPESTS